MQHLRLAIALLMLSTGVGGLTAAIIFWYRVRSETLLIIVAETALFALGLLVSIGVFYMQEIAATEINLSRIAGYINGVLVLILYSGLFGLTRQVSRKSVALPILLGVAVVSVYVLFAFVGPAMPVIRGWMGRNQIPVTLISVFSASGFLGVCGSQLRHPEGVQSGVIERLLRSLGTMLIVFALFSALSTAIVVVVGQSVDLTGALNFLLFAGWNGMLIASFVRYLARPADVFDGQIPAHVSEQYGISPREADVIRHLSDGLSNKEIAERMSVSATTVRTHLYNAFKKTGAASRMELLRILSSR